MKYLAVLVSVVIVSVSCNSSNKKLSKSYGEIESYLNDAKIGDKEIIFFFAGKPRMPLPNVYCFDSAGVELSAPPQCFQYIEEYIGFLGDSTIPIKADGRDLDTFLRNTPIIDSYDNPVTYDSTQRYNYYLFIDWLAIPDPSMQQTLYKAAMAVRKSSKRIKLFLVHAISSVNANGLSGPVDQH